MNNDSSKNSLTSQKIVDYYTIWLSSHEQPSELMSNGNGEDNLVGIPVRLLNSLLEEHSLSKSSVVMSGTILYFDNIKVGMHVQLTHENKGYMAGVVGHFDCDYVYITGCGFLHRDNFSKVGIKLNKDFMQTANDNMTVDYTEWVGVVENIS